MVRVVASLAGCEAILTFSWEGHSKSVDNVLELSFGLDLDLLGLVLNCGSERLKFESLRLRMIAISEAYRERNLGSAGARAQSSGETKFAALRSTLARSAKSKFCKQNGSDDAR